MLGAKLGLLLYGDVLVMYIWNSGLLICVVKRTGLSLIWKEIPKTGFPDY